MRSDPHDFAKVFGLVGLLAAAAWRVDVANGNDAEVPDTTIRLTAAAAARQIYPGPATNVLAYTGELVSGSPDSLAAIPGSYLGPIIRAHRGQTLDVAFVNQLTEDTNVHWHGLLVPPEMDGHPQNAVASGQTFDYSFRVPNRAGPYWFHPHPHELVPTQVYGGLAGLMLVTDEEEAALGLPSGAYDVPLVIQDRRVNASNQFVYSTGGMEGFLGNRILVNGFPDFVLSAATRVYRFRCYNGSNSRIYKLGWADGTPLTVIATDGGLLEAPVSRSYVMLAPGERVELWCDLRDRIVGTQMTLRSLAFSGAGLGGFPTLPNGAAFDVMRVSIDHAEPETLTLPSQLSTIARYQLQDAINANNPRTFALAMGTGQWLLNGGTFEMTGVAPNEIVKANTLEVWRFTNTSGMMQMAHPMHVHGALFQVLDRQITSEGASNYETVRHGYVDSGWKDTILLMPGETVRILFRMSWHAGLFLYHCHNLEHENAGMMRNYRIDPNPCDMDGDGNVDLTDFAQFEICFTGPGGALAPECEPGDSDTDGDVDKSDFAVFQLNYDGP